MASGSMDFESRRWLAGTPGPQDIQLQIEAGDSVEITQEVRSAFEHLVQTLRGDDLQGFAADPGCLKKILLCVPNAGCHVEHQNPGCYVEYNCMITKIG